MTTAARNAYSVSSADVDGDGDIDLLSASYIDDKIAWYENTAGDGSAWITHTVTTSADWAASVAGADVDGDGDADLLSASKYDDKIAWYENTAGDGSAWTTHTVTTSANGAYSVSWADVDGDGDADLLSASFADDKIAWYENTAGDGSTWTTHIVTTGADGAKSVAWADVDDDGDVDLLSASYPDDKIAWYENTTGDGSAWTTHTVTTTADGAYAVSWADVDGDGDADLLSVSRNDSKIAWYENRTIHRNGYFPTTHTVSTVADGARSVAWADVDGDGDPDLLAASDLDDKIAWYENTVGDGSAWTARTVTATAYGASAVSWTDVDGDGDPDLLSASSIDDKIAWYENSAGNGSTWMTHTVTTGADFAFSVAWADVDGDGDADLLSASSGDHKIAWYENSAGDGSAWTTHTVTTAVAGAISVAWADVDGDGDPDLLSASFGDSKIAWYENSAGDGSAWTTHTVTTGAASAVAVAGADVDGDGDADLLSASAGDDKIAWYENTAGNGSAWTTHTVSTAVDAAYSVAWVDVDGDGDVDLLSASFYDDKIAWYENRGGQFALDTFNTAPTTLDQGSADDVLEIEMWHLGRSGDTDEELASLELLFEETAGDPLSSGEANALIANLHVYLDDGSGSFEPGSDTLVTTVAALNLTAGVETLSFTDGDANVQVMHGTPETFFVVPELTADAFFQTPNRFRITHVTESSSTAEDRDHDIPLTLEYAADVSSSITTAGCRADNLQIDNYTFSGVTVTCTGDTTLATSNTVAVSGSSDLTFTSPSIGLNGGFRVEAGSVFRAGP